MSRSERLLEEMAQDHRSGAIVLTLKAGEALRALTEEMRSQPVDQAHIQMERFSQRLLQVHPAMASIRNLVTRTLQAIGTEGSSGAARLIEEFTRSLEASVDEIAQSATGLILSGSKIMTISCSSTFLRTIEIAKRQGKAFSVICPESRPLNEGLTLAQKLSQLGVPTTICTDGLAPSLVRECDLVIVGGDALAPEGLVNKIGTYPLALAAREAGVPLVALISTHKFLVRFDPSWMRANDPQELVPPKMENIDVCNRYFDLTPLLFIQSIVTEQGIYSSCEIKELLLK